MGLVASAGATSAVDMAALLRMDVAVVTGVLNKLVHMGRIRVEHEEASVLRFVADSCVIPVGASAGWEAALLDHFSGRRHDDDQQAGL